MKRILGILTVIIIIIIIIGIILAYKRVKIQINTYSALLEKRINASSFLTKGGTTNECSYSIWFIVDKWTNNPKILFERVKKENKIEVKEFIVSFDDYVNNINIFLPELKDEYKKSTNCKITTKQINEDNDITTEKQCKNKCSQFNKDITCNSFYWDGHTENIDRGQITWDIESNTVKGNKQYDIFMENTENMATGPTGNCYLFSSNSSIPKNCFIGENTKQEKPYSVYDWDDFIYSNNIISYTKEKCSIPISIQKWNNLIITIKNLIMEIYINGKIVKSCKLTKEIRNDVNSVFVITPNNYGFNGSTLYFNYWDKCLSSQEIFNLSKKVLM